MTTKTEKPNIDQLRNRARRLFLSAATMIWTGFCS
jgi:hypothetical protein